MLESAPSLSRGSFMQMLPRQDLRLSQRLTLPLKMVLLSPAFFLLRMLKIEPNSPAVHASSTIQGFAFSASAGVHVSFTMPINTSPPPQFLANSAYVS